MIRTSIVTIVVCLVSGLLLFGAARLQGAGLSVSIAECDSGEPCVRVYKTNKDIESQTYKVVKFSEDEIVVALTNNPRRLHDKIKDETGFDCKKGDYESQFGYFRCEEGVIVTRHEKLVTALRSIY